MDITRMGPVVFVLLSLVTTGLSQCVVENRTLAHNETYEDCSQKCRCVSGLIECEDTCGPITPPDCPNPVEEVPPDECCPRYICPDCPAGRWGRNCSRECGHCATESRTCNMDTGKCPPNTPLCSPGYFGEMCTEPCPTGFYGTDCLSLCGACAAGKCKSTDGACFPNTPLCKTGSKGVNCHDACEPGRFGPECRLTCGGCKGGRTTCNPESGTCPGEVPRCLPGYMGPSCKECPKGKWGEECGNNCSSHCARGRLECDVRDGRCLWGCKDNYTGAVCESVRTERSGNEDVGWVIGLAVGVSVVLLAAVSLIFQLLLFGYRHPESKLSRVSSYFTPNATGSAKIAEEGKAPDSLGPVPPIPLVSREEFSFYETMLPSSNWRVKMDSLVLKKKFMIQGNFGQTQLAKWHYTSDSPKTIPVGLKRFRGNFSDEKKAQCRKELRKLRGLERNINVLTILGTAKDRKTGDTLLMLEWAAEGNLLEYLKRKRSTNQKKTELSQETLIKLCLDVSQAMVHLSSNKVHGVVLAAKTILLDKNFDAKVTGFFHFKVNNMSRDEKLEIRELRRWAALEYLVKKNHCSAGDVWGLGVLLWEVFSLGETPYKEFSVKALREQLVSGFRLSHPAKASTTLYVLMTECWQANPSLRPSFEDIVKRLQEIPSESLRNARGATYDITTLGAISTASTTDPTTHAARPTTYAVDPTTHTADPPTYAVDPPTYAANPPTYAADPTNSADTSTDAEDRTNPADTFTYAEDRTNPADTSTYAADPTNPADTSTYAVDPTNPADTSTDAEDRTNAADTSTDVEDRTNPADTSTDVEDRTNPADTSTYAEDRTNPADTSTDVEDRTNPADTSTYAEDRTNPADTSAYAEDPTNPADTSTYAADPTNPTDTSTYAADPANPADTSTYAADPANPADTSTYAEDPTNPEDTSTNAEDPSNYAADVDTDSDHTVDPIPAESER